MLILTKLCKLNVIFILDELHIEYTLLHFCIAIYCDTIYCHIPRSLTNPGHHSLS